MTDKQKKVKHWSERLVAFMSFLAIILVVVTDNGMQIWAEPPPTWLYFALAANVLGFTTEEIKEVAMKWINVWMEAKARGGKS